MAFGLPLNLREGVLMADKPVHEVEGVDAALDALSSPSSSDVFEAVDLFSSKAVASVAAKRSLAGGGGGSQPDPARECALESFGLPLDGSDVPWNAIYDRDGNAVGAIPANMGMDLSIDTRFAVANQAGIWSFNLVFNPVEDATAVVRIFLSVSGTYSGGPQFVQIRPTDSVLFEYCLSWVASLKSGDGAGVNASAEGATASPYAVLDYATLEIVRLA